MTKLFLSFFIAITCLPLYGQKNNLWISFFNKDSSLVGFKDINGNIRIKPKYEVGFTIAKKFDKISAIESSKNDTIHTAYLLKNQQVIGRDSVYYFDNTPDCESEGFIRLKDYKNDKVGMLDGNGQVVIQAKYNELLPVRNGLIVALEGAEKKYWEGSDYEHYSWEGGHQLLLNTKGKVLIDDFKYQDNLCFHSLIISNTPLGDSIRENFKSREGKYYSFINFKKEFTQWLHGKFLHVLSPDPILSYSFENITFWTEADGWKSDPKKLFMYKNYALLQEEFNELKSHQCDFQILEEDLNPFIFESKLFEEYFDNCGNAKSWENPILNVIISHQLHGALVQDHFEFLRTSKGYKLLCVSMRSANLK